MADTAVVSETSTYTIELKVTGAPPLKADYVYYDVTGLRITYEADEVTKLTVLGVASDTGEAEEIGTRLDRYDMVAPWIRREVAKHRATNRLAAYRAAVLHEAADIVGEPIPEGAPTEEWEDLVQAGEAIREKAGEAERIADPGWHPKDFLKNFISIVEP